MDRMDELESQGIFDVRELIESYNRVGLIFNGDKDDVVLFHLIRKAYYPGTYPISLIHTNYSNEFPEVVAFKQNLEKNYKITFQSPVTHAQLSLGHNPSKNKSRPYEAYLSSSCENQLMERFWDIKYNQENNNMIYCNPLQAWSEAEKWEYILKENMNLPNLFFAHSRLCLQKANGDLIPMSPHLEKEEGDHLAVFNVRYEKIDELTSSSLIKSNASNLQEIIEEINKDEDHKKESHKRTGSD